MSIFSIFIDPDSKYQPELKNKGYLHFDSINIERRFKKVLEKLESQSTIQHTFFPLIRYKKPKVRRNSEKSISIDWNNPRYVLNLF